MKRVVKSYVLRAGRISPRQQYGLETCLPQYSLKNELTPWKMTSIFPRQAETIVEIGFGMGASLFEQAQENPQLNFIGIEVHRAGVGSLAASLSDANLSNVKIIEKDACEVFQQCIEDESLHGIQIFFPDPWPKKRHHKRRLIQADFVRLLVKKLKPGGILHCATDWQEYAEHMDAVLTAEPGLKNQQSSGGYTPRPETRPLTKFEKRGKNLGHGVFDLVFTRK